MSSYTAAARPSLDRRDDRGEVVVDEDQAAASLATHEAAQVRHPRPAQVTSTTPPALKHADIGIAMGRGWHGDRFVG
jgi:hypothetical protein